MTIYNPYNERCSEINREIESLIASNKKLKDDIEWYEINNLEDLNNSFESIIAEEKELIYQLDVVKKSKEELEKTQIGVKSKLKSPYNLFYFRSETQRKLRKQAIEIREKLWKQIVFISANSERVEKIKFQKWNLTIKINKYTTLEIDDSKKRIEDNNGYLKTLKIDLDTVASQKRNVDEKLKPTIIELDKVKRKIIELNALIDKAEYYNHKLDQEKNPYERKMIHVECERICGHGKPYKILKSNKELLERNERDLIKLEKRAKEEIEKLLRKIDSIIIDGNNMCYENSKFIGLTAIIPLLLNISKKHKVTIIFDADIRGLLRQDNESIIKQFDEKVKVHIVASKVKADETILDLASSKRYSYVISNDRYAEYSDKEVVENKRLFTHEIIGHRLLIHDLDINMTF